MIAFIRRSTTMVHVVQRQRSIHQPATTALAAFYWAAATWVTASSSTSSSSSSFVVFGFNGGGSPPAFSQRPSARGGANTILSKIRCGSTSTTVEQTIASALPAPAMMTAQSKVDAFRGRMKELGLDVYLIPTDDPHLSGSYGAVHCMIYFPAEYVPEAYKRRAFLTGFGGSAGTAVVTAKDALLWTDSRYWNEASMQLDDSVWTLQKSGLDSTPTIPKWLSDTAKDHYKKAENNKALRIGLDPFVHAASFAKEVEDHFAATAKDEGWLESPGVLVTEHANLVDPIWTERPPVPVSPFRIHPLKYAGTSVAEKIAALRSELVTKKASALVLCALEDVAYVYNVRAKGDIDTCPVGISYGLITQSDAFLYCDDQKVVDDVVDHLQEGGVTIKPYDSIIADLKAHCATTTAAKVWIDKTRANYALSSALDPSQMVDAQNPVTPMKAVKNEAEMAGMREAHIVDGVAMAHFMAWLEAEIASGRAVSEVEIDTVLTGFRAEQEGFVECSFPTIAGVGANGAIIHYRAQPDSDIMKSLDKSAPILIDSGGQYTYGTTDVTRTWSFQETPDPVFVDYYTRVLKGNIGLDSMVFPVKTPGFVLDVYARRWLWEIGSDYGHGTGHVSLISHGFIIWPLFDFN
jgi:Xaa-Pro aminopeptidase